MGYVQGEGRTQGTLFPVCWEERLPGDPVCRVIDAFVDRLDLAGLGWERAEAAETGRPGYDPRDLRKLYLYGYLQQIRSSRRLESECRRNIEWMWLLGRLAPDHKTIAEFRRIHREGVTAAGAARVRLARSLGLLRGAWVAIDGSKFQTVSSERSVRERQALERYLEQLEQRDQQEEVVIDPGAVAHALEKLRRHPEPEARLMRTAKGFMPADHVQAAGEAEHKRIVAQPGTDQATDNRSLQPMAEAAQAAVGGTQPIKVVADAGYSNGEQAEACEAKGILRHVPANRAVNHPGDGTLFDRTEFIYQPKRDTFLCPAGHPLARKQLSRKDRAVDYMGEAGVCGSCTLKSKCTTGAARLLTHHLHEDALQRRQPRATPEAMRLRRSPVEHPFANLKYRILGHPRFLWSGLRGAQTEISLGAAAYNLKRMQNILGGYRLTLALKSF